MKDPKEDIRVGPRDDSQAVDAPAPSAAEPTDEGTEATAEENEVEAEVAALEDPPEGEALVYEYIPPEACDESTGAAAQQPEPVVVDKAQAEETGAPDNLVGVRLTDGKVMEFNPGQLKLVAGDPVVVDNERDLNLGRVVYKAPNLERRSLRRVLRRISPQDLLILRRNAKREEEAFELCQRKIAERRLEMKLIRVAYLHGGNKAIFYFSAEGRVDFRALVRDLAQQLHVRIEMRQIGVRDESKMLGGVGICGQPLCCARFLRKFVPVSIKMAKNQGLALNPQKVSGVCGRLMCCLVYEDDTYRELRKGFPRVGKVIATPKGEGKVLEADVIGGKLRILLEDGPVIMHVDELRAPPPSAQPAESAVAEPSAEPARRQAAGRPRSTGEARQDGRRSRNRRHPGQAAEGASAAPAPTSRPGAGTAPAPTVRTADEAVPAARSADGAVQAQPPDGEGARRKKRRRRGRRRKPGTESGSPGAGGNPNSAPTD